MPVVSPLSELRDELDYLAASIRISKDKDGPNSNRCRYLKERSEQIKIAIKIHKESNPFRTIFVYVVARTYEEAQASAKLLGWDRRSDAETHRTIVRRVQTNWTIAQTYRVWKIRIFRRAKKDEIISALVSTHPRYAQPLSD